MFTDTSANLTSPVRVLARPVKFALLIVFAGIVPSAYAEHIDLNTINRESPQFVADQSLLFAAETGRLDAIQYALEQGADINARDLRPQRHTALMLAIRAGWTQVAEFLIESDADVNLQGANGWTSLLLACNNNMVSVVGALLKNKANPNYQQSTSGMTPLLLAAQNGNQPIIQILLKYKANPNLSDSVRGNTPLIEIAAHRTGLPSVVDLIAAGADINQTANDGWSPLMSAINYGNIRIIEVLLLNGVKPELETSDGRTALILAAERNFATSLEMLIKAGARVNAKSGKNALTALGRAAAAGAEQAVFQLIKANADVNLPGKDGEPPLLHAARAGYTPIIQLLLGQGANVNAQSTETGNTALMLAANLGYADIVDLLLTAGADPNIKAKDSWTAMKAAQMVGEIGIVEIIKSHSKN